MTIPVLDLTAQYRTIGAEVMLALARVLEAQHFILGPEVRGLEEEIARYCGTRFAVGVASGTDAILLALQACGLKEGDEVITTPFSFVATADTITALRAVPVFVDIDPDTFNLDVTKIEARITARTRAILPVHLYGQTSDMEPILALATRYSLKVIEDNAQAIGATHQGKRTGSLGDAGCLSFFPSKNLGGYGDGGMVVTDSEEVADRVRRLRAHGARAKYFSEEQGYNSRLDELQAAVLRVKLRHLDDWNGRRRAHAHRYNALLSGLPGVTCPTETEHGVPVYHQYTIRVSRRDGVQRYLKERGIGTMIYYPTPLHLQPLFAGYGYQAGDLPEAERAAQEVLSLPMFPELTDDQVRLIVETLAEAVRFNS
jgi:dTDP-4-amino-4,6-dideoxygalactose transaminase